MRKTAIVMDSTGYLTPDIIKKFDIEVIPLTVHIKNQAFPENEISNNDFFAMLSSKSETSTTSQPSVGAFQRVYSDLKSRGYEEILSLHLSEKISGTINSAKMAKDLLKDRIPIHIFDSKSAALSLGLLAWSAAEWANQGLNGQEIMDKLERLRVQTKLYFVVDTLEYLHRGGRIGGAAALFGTLLNLKPILYFNTEGMIDVFSKVRSKNKALERVLNELEKDISKIQPYRIAVFHVQAPDEAQQIAESLRRKYPVQDIRIFEAGPVIAAHVGPGALALAYQPWPIGEEG